MKPASRPARPYFSSGPCAKRPGWSLGALEKALLGRSHRSKPGKAAINEVVARSRAILGVPADWKVAIVPASDTGAMEMVMWTMLGARGVDMLAWESFGQGWVADVTKQLKLADVRVIDAPYGMLPDLAKVDTDRDVVFTWNGTTSGVRVPDGSWIKPDRQGLTIADATSAAFAMELPWDRLDVVTWSWQKVLGGEAAHGMLALSPRAVARLESFVPPRPLPKIFRLVSGGKFSAAIFEGETINTPSMLCVEDALDGLRWAESVGGLKGLIARTNANASALDAWVKRTPWAGYLAQEQRYRSPTSVCVKIVDPAVQALDAKAQQEFVKRLAGLLDAEGVAFDVAGHRDAPAHLRIWCGATIETADIEALAPWLDWAWGEAQGKEASGMSANPLSNSAPRVLIADALSPRAMEIFRERGVMAEEAVGLKPEALKAKIKDFDGLAIRSATKVTAEVLAAAPRLKVVGRAGIGVDNVDVPAATQRGVVVMNTPFGNSITTAEHTIAMMFALARQLPAANASTHAGKWEKSRFMGVELYGKSLGVIGCGNIGAIVAERAIGLHMRVIAFDPYLSDERAVKLGVEKVSLDDLLARADFITFHTPLTDSTRGILNKATLAKTKKGVRIINCARGGLVVEADLRAAIESGHVAGAAFDVFTEEPAKQNPLFGLEQVVCTPHLGASTTEAQENVAVQVAEQMADFLITGAVANALNMPSVTAEEAPRLKPYMKLAEQLGSFAGQITETGLKEVRIEYEGQVAALNTKPLTAVALAGLLTPLMDSVNMVNAPVIARERGIDVAETRHDRASDYQTLIRLSVTTDRRTRTLAGTLFGGDKPRLVEVEGIAIEAELTPHMLYCRNADKPGLIGSLGKLLGDNQVNIATMHLGRDQPGGEAVALLAVDQRLSGDLLDCVRELPQIKQAKALRF